MGNDTHYYKSLDEFKELNMTTFGKMKLSVIPEGVSMAVYNFFKTCKRDDKFPSYDEFFQHCTNQCATDKRDLKPRFDSFYKACEKYKLDPNGVTHFDTPTPKEDPLVGDIEQEFWRVERHKLTPDGIAAMHANGEILNPYRNKMKDMGCHKLDKLFTLYIQAYPDSHRVKDFESHKAYLNALFLEFHKFIVASLKDAS